MELDLDLDLDLDLENNIYTESNEHNVQGKLLEAYFGSLLPNRIIDNQGIIIGLLSLPTLNSVLPGRSRRGESGRPTVQGAHPRAFLRAHTDSIHDVCYYRKRRELIYCCQQFVY